MDKKQNHGGAREGAGAKKKYKEETKAKTFRLPMTIIDHLNSKENATAYIISLIEEDMNNKF